MKKIGFLLRDLGASELNYFFIKHANGLVEEGVDVTAFYENMARPCLRPNFAVMQMPEVWLYNGIAVATTLSAATKLSNCPGPLRKFFYVWDLEWLRQERKAYRDFASVYQHPELQLVSRGADHKQAVEEAWNRPCLVIESCNIKEFLEENHAA